MSDDVFQAGGTGSDEIVRVRRSRHLARLITERHVRGRSVAIFGAGCKELAGQCRDAGASNVTFIEEGASAVADIAISQDILSEEQVSGVGELLIMDWNGAAAGAVPYGALIQRLQQNFEVVDCGCLTSLTSRLIVAWRTIRARDLDLRCPFEMIRPRETLFTCAVPYISPDGTAYWSRIFKLQDEVVKQAQPSRIACEVTCLTRLAQHASDGLFPSLLKSGEGWCSLELIYGQAFEQAGPGLMVDLTTALAFISDVIQILHALLASNITHRDISPTNLLVRNGRPVLIDFGWAEIAGNPEDFPAITPPRLGGAYRAPEGFDDVYSMGLTLRRFFGGRSQALDGLFALMENPDARLRVRELRELDRIVQSLRQELLVKEIALI